MSLGTQIIVSMFNGVLLKLCQLPNDLRHKFAISIFTMGFEECFAQLQNNYRVILKIHTQKASPVYVNWLKQFGFGKILIAVVDAVRCIENLHINVDIIV